MEDLTASLDNYKVQLSQVEAALTLDAESEELLKLKQDLVEVIQLTVDLIGSETAEKEAKKKQSAEKQKNNQKSEQQQWSSGDMCLAPKQDDGKYYQALVDEILPESETVVITFLESEKTDVCQVSLLKPFVGGDDEAATSSELSKAKAAQKKEKLIQQREYRKKRNLKKKMRLKEKEAESEISKNKWKDFNKKAFSKSSKGKVKKSIFASPEGVQGKVGIGTCGVADKRMTKFDHGAKYNARHLIPR